MTEVVERLSPAPPDLWREIVRQDPNAGVAQTPEWCAAVCAFTGHADVTAIYRLSNGKQFVLPMVRRRAQGAAWRFSLPRGWGYGGIVGPEPAADDLAAILGCLDGGPLASTAIRPNPLRLGQWDEAAQRTHGVTVRRFPHLDHVLDL